MKCPYCGWRYTQEEGRSPCEGCHMSGGCEMLKCPVCGYETPKEVNAPRFKFRFRRNKNGSN